MAIGDIIVGIDIGTSKVCTVVGEVNNFGQIEIICNTSYKCSGLKKGKIINEEDITLSIAKTIQDAEDETNLKINSAYVTIQGKYVTIVQNTITKEVKDKYSGISVRDVQSAIMQVKDIDIPDGETLIDIVPDKITLDNGNVVADPVGNLSSSFTISAQVILAQKDFVRQLSSIFKKAGLEIDGIVPITLAERNLVLDKHELNDKTLSRAHLVAKDAVNEVILVGTKKSTASTGSYAWPLNSVYITSSYGGRTLNGYYDFHLGVDLRASSGTWVYASDGGEVVFAGYNGSYGYLIKIKHDNGDYTYYAHLSKIAVSSGTRVYKGQYIALSGATGNVTGAHLHFEIRKNGSTVNPVSYLPSLKGVVIISSEYLESCLVGTEAYQSHYALPVSFYSRKEQEECCPARHR